MSETPETETGPSLVPGGTADQEAAARKHTAAADAGDGMVAALLIEREGYVRFGRDERVAAVDAELEARGYTAAARARAAGGAEAEKAPRARRSRPAETS